MLFQSSNDRKFYELLRGAAGNICASAELFRKMTENLALAPEFAGKLKDLEHMGDDYTHQLLALLNSTFVTPLEREDILALSQELDDMVDGIEATASRMAIYGISESDEHIRAFTMFLEQQSAEIAAAVQLLGTKDLTRIREHNRRIKVLEKNGDEELRRGLVALFSGHADPVHLMKIKEIYETLESTTDRAEDVADTLESVVMKNA